MPDLVETLLEELTLEVTGGDHYLEQTSQLPVLYGDAQAAQAPMVGLPGSHRSGRSRRLGVPPARTQRVRAPSANLRRVRKALHAQLTEFRATHRQRWRSQAELEAVFFLLGT